MKTYKLLRLIRGKLYPLYVNANQEMPTDQWIDAEVGQLADENHVRSRLGPLALRPGFHSCEVPFTDWIGRKGRDGKLYQRQETVWCECEVDGKRLQVNERRGLRTIPQGWYYFRTKPGQLFPWVISGSILIRRILRRSEVEALCDANGVQAQPMWTEKGGTYAE